MKPTFFAALLFICASALFLGYSSQAVADEVVETSADDMLGIYLKNELAGDQQFKGKKVKVTGEIRDISKSPTGHYYVTLKAKDMMRAVQCFFPESQLEALLKLEKGKQLTTTCDVRGLGMLNLELIDCAL